MAPTIASATTLALSRSMPIRSAVLRATLRTSASWSSVNGGGSSGGFASAFAAPSSVGRLGRLAGLRLAVEQALHERLDHRLGLVLERRLELADDVADHALGGLEGDRGDQDGRRGRVDAEPQHVVRAALAALGPGRVEVGLGHRAEQRRLFGRNLVDRRSGERGHHGLLVLRAQSGRHCRRGAVTAHRASSRAARARSGPSARKRPRPSREVTAPSQHPASMPTGISPCRSGG